METKNLKVCLVHDWLVTYRGGEKVLGILSDMFPRAPIFTLFYDPSKMPEIFATKKISTPPFSSLLKPFRKMLLPVLPTMMESFDLSGFDLVLSSSSCVAKGAIKSEGAKHLCYIHSPMRYVWDQMEEYIQGLKHIPGAETFIRLGAPKLRDWDVSSASRVDHFVANSHFVKKRVENYYHREATVIHPPIAVESFLATSNTVTKDGYFLAAGALVAYKRFDLAIEACNRLRRRLIVAGSGPMLDQLRQLAGPTIEFIIQPHDDTFKRLLAGADALIFPGVEDFGMIAIETMASGTPVIAFKGGGALDFIEEGRTGLFFDEQHPESLVQRLESFQNHAFSREELQNFSKKFDEHQFKEKIMSEIRSL